MSIIEITGSPAEGEAAELLDGLFLSKAGAVNASHVGFKGKAAPLGGEMWVETLPAGELLVLTRNAPDGFEVIMFLFPSKSRVFADVVFPVGRATALILDVGDPALDRVAVVKQIIDNGRSAKALKEARDEFKKAGDGAWPIDALAYTFAELQTMLQNYDPNRRPWQLPESAPRIFVAFVPNASNPEVEHGQHPQAQTV
jgi:hypothetical protein